MTGFHTFRINVEFSKSCRWQKAKDRTLTALTGEIYQFFSLLHVVGVVLADSLKKVELHFFSGIT